ncbi:MAG: TRAM domain-containing protein [Spirochaetes bacterium]|nr:TRAM domain-containing protein [Spirochaetota bacterium]
MIKLYRVLFVLIGMAFAYLFFSVYSPFYAAIASGIGGIISLVFLIVIEYVSHSFSARILFSSSVGLLGGLIAGLIVSLSLSVVDLPLSGRVIGILRFYIVYIFAFASMIFMAVKNEDFALFDRIIPSKEGGTDGSISYKILDTSVIIDGRIADICDTGFVEGVLVIPNFVLNELQMIADSADSIKRNRGRRGLDILNKMQKDQSIKVKISDMDFPDIPEVDSKLVKLAKVMNAKVVTNDFNLNKVAEFHGVHVLNINLLANSLKPVVLPGEEMKVSLVKEGKDQNQAIGYLEDGTMVVVENGRKKMHSEVEVTVTSVLQTTAGRMIFGRIKD